MKNTYFNIVKLFLEKPSISQIKIAKELGVSGAYISKILFKMEREHYLTRLGKPVLKLKVTNWAKAKYENCKVKNAIIFADGIGINFVPIIYSKPRGLIKVNGEKIIERQINFLKEKGINDITIVVGYLKEQYDYLIDKYDVKLVYNDKYKLGSLSSLIKVKDILNNTYIISSSTYMKENIFNTHESQSFLTYSHSKVRHLRSIELGQSKRVVKILDGTSFNCLEGIAYFDRKFKNSIAEHLEKPYGEGEFGYYDLLRENIKDIEIYGREVTNDMLLRIDSLEQLRLYDEKYLICSYDKCLSLISSIFQCKESEIVDIKPQKIGMTNKSFLFSFKGNKYIFRLPGEGTEILIDRSSEYSSYQAVASLKCSDSLVYFNPAKGYKISKFLEGCRNSSSTNENDIKESLRVIKKLHDSKLSVPHVFDLKERINFYDKISRENNANFFEDYSTVKEEMFELLDNINKYDIEKCLCHIDFIYDNVLTDGNKYYLIDWEYSATADPLLDLAMYSIYAYYEEEQINHLMYLYFGCEPTHEQKVRVYSYIAIAGFLWSIWVIYKQTLGVEFGDYGLKMYRYAKEYYKKVKSIL